MEDFCRAAAAGFMVSCDNAHAVHPNHPEKTDINLSLIHISIKKGCKTAADAAAAIGEGLQAFCIPGSVADQRKVGLGHGNLGKMLLEEDTDCFAFLAGHESFAAAEGAIGIAEKANKVRKKPLRVILNRCV